VAAGILGGLYAKERTKTNDLAQQVRTLEAAVAASENALAQSTQASASAATSHTDACNALTEIMTQTVHAAGVFGTGSPHGSVAKRRAEAAAAAASLVVLQTQLDSTAIPSDLDSVKQQLAQAIESYTSFFEAVANSQTVTTTPFVEANGLYSAARTALNTACPAPPSGSNTFP
jgi:hypothetical protein